MHYKTKPLFLILGIIFLVAGIPLLIYELEYGHSNFGALSLFIGVVFIVIYFATRKHVITISSDRGKDLDVEMKGTSKERIDEFLTKIQEAKQTKLMNTFFVR